MAPPSSPSSSRRPPPPGLPFTERVRPRTRRGVALAAGLSVGAHLVAFVVLLLLPTGGPAHRPGFEVPDWLVQLARPLAREILIALDVPAGAPTPTAAVEPPLPPSTPLVLPALPSGLPALPEPAAGAPTSAPSGFVGVEVPEGAGAAPGGAEGTGGPPSPVERLRPGEKDPRLWALLPKEIVGLSPEQRLQLELALAIAAVGDSAAAAAEAARRGTDWTYTDEEGRRWGFSPGQLHLGDITIPLPFGFAPPPNSLAARRAREDAEIAQQAGRQEAAQTLRDRAAEIRRRRDAERARARGDTAVVRSR